MALPLVLVTTWGCTGIPGSNTWFPLVNGSWLMVDTAVVDKFGTPGMFWKPIPWMAMHNYQVSCIRWSVEAFFGRMRGFKVLSGIWKHGLRHHKCIFLAIAAIVQVVLVDDPLRAQY